MITQIHKKSTLLLIFLVTLFSCEIIDPSDNKPNPNLNNNVIDIGHCDSTFHHNKFDPEREFQLQPSGCGETDGQDSIDLENDGEFDIIINGHICDYEYYFANCCPEPMNCIPNGSEFHIKLAENYELTSYTDSSKDFNVSFIYVDILNAGNYIDTVLTFTTGKNLIYLWSEMLPYDVTNGLWYKIGSEKYFALRKKVNDIYKYGWVKIRNSVDNDLTLLEYAFEK